MLHVIEEALVKYKNENPGKTPIMVFDDLDMVLCDDATENAATTLCEWLIEQNKNDLASIKFVTSDQRLFPRMKTSKSF